ncbi:hypothetical protein MUK42_12432 [Musa troglodytarum]|uniref:Uncharacterized protein n=1 Tax=Musa troglodytarum TaxID=320322 RepID=A0A9E7FIB8_9LILI|nr:hypothetical protein MUK42_12432 [Musa troglodytarum]
MHASVFSVGMGPYQSASFPFHAEPPHPPSGWPCVLSFPWISCSFDIYCKVLHVSRKQAHLHQWSSLPAASSTLLPCGGGVAPPGSSPHPLHHFIQQQVTSEGEVKPCNDAITKNFPPPYSAAGKHSIHVDICNVVIPEVLFPCHGLKINRRSAATAVNHVGGSMGVCIYDLG